MSKCLFIYCFVVVLALTHSEPPSIPLRKQQSAYHFIGNSLDNSYVNTVGSLQSPYPYRFGYANSPVDITEVHKHIYFHVPPPESEEPAMTPHVFHQRAPRQKHYKIVFIKSPSAPPVRAPIVPPAPENEEKTLIYVLHKKPEAQPDIVIPTPSPTKPSKPEVYYIKYRAKKDKTLVHADPPASFNVEPQTDYGVPISNGIEDSRPVNPNEQQEQFEEFHSSGANYKDAISEKEQYLLPETTAAPIVVAELDDQHRIADNRYGNRKRYFIKRRK